MTEARLIPMWFVRTPSEVRAHYTKPKKVPKRPSQRRSPHGMTEEPETEGFICDGKWTEAAFLKADDGWREIQAKLDELNPEDATKYREWNKADAPEASHFFKPISENEAA